MFLTGPRAAPAAGPALRRAAFHRDDTDSPLAAHPTLRPYLTDLAATHGLALRKEVLGTGQAYAELAAPAVEAVTAPDEPVDLLVLAYGVPDVQPGRNVAPHLASRCPGDPLAFAICDQGPAAAFTALRLIVDYAATGACTRAVLVVAEQAALPYPLAAPAPVPDGHAAVALLFEPGPAPVEVRTHPGLPPESVGAVLAAELAGVDPDATLVLGPGLDGLPGMPATGVRRSDPGLPHTGTWAHLADGEPGRPTVLADYEPALGYLCVATSGTPMSTPDTWSTAEGGGEDAHRREALNGTFVGNTSLT